MWSPVTVTLNLVTVFVDLHTYSFSSAVCVRHSLMGCGLRDTVRTPTPLLQAGVPHAGT